MSVSRVFWPCPRIWRRITTLIDQWRSHRIRLTKVQAVAFMLADMAINLELSRLITYRSAWEWMQGRPRGYFSSIAKCFCADTANIAASNAVQILGGSLLIVIYLCQAEWCGFNISLLASCFLMLGRKAYVRGKCFVDCWRCVQSVPVRCSHVRS